MPNILKNKQEPLIIAEIGNNHEGNFNLAKKMIVKAKEAGVDAVKIQIIKPNKFFDKSSVETKKKYNRFLFSDKQYLSLYKFAKKKKIILFSTFFDFKTLERFQKFQPFIKVASCDNNNFEFISYLLKFNKPTFISTGLLNYKEINDLYNSLNTKKNKKYLKNITFLYCVSAYPTAKNEINLINIKFLKKKYPKINVGFSDHTIGIKASCYSILLGAKVIEKHFTLDKNYSNFRDHKLSADFPEMREIVNFAREMPLFLGKKNKNISEEEKLNLKVLRRYPHTNKDLKKNHIIKFSDIDFYRSKKKIKLKKNQKFVGKKLLKNTNVGEMLDRNLFKR